jgi:hypothetical protein
MSKQASNVLIKDEKWGWIPAVQRGIEKNKASVEVWTYPDEQSVACDNGKGAKGKFEKRVVDLKEYENGCLPLQNVDSNGTLLEVADMVKLPYLHEVRAAGLENQKVDRWFSGRGFLSLLFHYFFIITGWYSFQYEKTSY